MDTTSPTVGATINRPEHTAQVQKKLNTRKMKAGGEHGHPAVVYSAFICLLRCLPVIMYLITALAAASAGLSAIQRSTMHNIERARVEARGARLTFFAEEQIDNQLHHLTAKRLPRNFIETYDECLARGLRHANDHFYGDGFQYPHVRNQTIDWVMENCGRLHHAPQVMQPSVEVKVLYHIIRAASRARRIAEMVAEFATLKAKALWAKISTHCLVKTVAPGQHQPLTSIPPKHRLQKPLSRQSILLPHGFRLLYKDASSCQLVYAMSPVQALLHGSMPVDKVPLSEDAVKKMFIEHQSLLRLHRGLELMNSAATWLALLLTPLQLAGVIHWIVKKLASIKAIRPPLDQQRNLYKTALDLLRRYHKEQPINVLCMATQIGSLLVRAIPASTSARRNRVELVLGLCLLVGSQMMLICCGPHLCSAVVEMGRTATLYGNKLRPIALVHFNKVRRIASHPQELGHTVSAYYNQLRLIVLGYFNKMRHIVSHPGELASIVSTYYAGLRRIAPKHYDWLSRSVSHYGGEIHGFFNYWLNTKARLGEYWRKNTATKAKGNESESGGVVMTSNETSPDVDRNNTQSMVDGDTDTDTDSETDSEVGSDTGSSRTPIVGEDESDSDFDTGSESNGSITPVSDEDEDWAIVDLADA